MANTLKDFGILTRVSKTMAGISFRLFLPFTFQNISRMRLWLWVGMLLLSACTGRKQDQSNIAYTLSQSQLPAYESDIDHKGMINGLQNRYDESLRTGQYIYQKGCFNCHGDPVQQGAIPVAFKFWKDNFKAGNDPYSIYKTLTKGFGSMPPQVQLTPSEKYDVINYITHEFVLGSNKDQYFKIDSAYLNGLPKGTSHGPDPTDLKPWAQMDYGNFLINTYELVERDAKPREISGGKAPLPDENLLHNNFAYKGIAVRLDPGKGGVASGNAFVVFDHDLMRVAGAWTGKGFIDWEGILFNGAHNISPRNVGDLQFSTPVEPGWADPDNGSFQDTRFMASDKRRFGPLPRSWAHYKGLYVHDGRPIISYSVGEANVLEMFGYDSVRKESPVFTRTMNISPSEKMLKMRITPVGPDVALLGEGCRLKEENGFVLLEVPAGRAVKIKLLIAKMSREKLNGMKSAYAQPEDLQRFTKGGPAQFTEVVKTVISQGSQEGTFQVDILNLPFNSPWKNQLRMSGIDFLKDKDKAVACSTDGDVWLISGITRQKGILSWKRIASGLFQPLGIKVVDEQIFVTCRDQLVRLNDFNGDGEIDFYEAYNSDHQVTNHFHEFAMGLQTDKDGNFYYAKSARHARRALVPQHGTLLKVSKDGSSTAIVAHGFRAANGVCINPDGSFLVTDQEGHWTPMNRINWVDPKNLFYGNMFGYSPPADSSEKAMEKPMVWIERNVDQSPSELLWVDSKKWGMLDGGLLNFSYGYGKIHLVLHEKVGSLHQGGLFELPMPRFSSGVMRGRFNPADGDLYVCGLSAWGSTQPELGGLYRIRYREEKSLIPIAMHALQSGMEITFSHPLNAQDAESLSSYKVETWDLKRAHTYGSKHYNTQTLQVTHVRLSPDKRTVTLIIPAIKPTWVMEISYQLKTQDQHVYKGSIQNTIHQLGINPSRPI